MLCETGRQPWTNTQKANTGSRSLQCQAIAGNSSRPQVCASRRRRWICCSASDGACTTVAGFLRLVHVRSQRTSRLFTAVGPSEPSVRPCGARIGCGADEAAPCCHAAWTCTNLRWWRSSLVWLAAMSCLFDDIDALLEHSCTWSLHAACLRHVAIMVACGSWH